MPRARNLVASHKRRKKIMHSARGYYGGRSRLLRTAQDAVRRAGAYSYAHRRKRPGDFRRLWIIRINAACRLNGLSYSKFMHGLKVLNIEIDRKILAELAVFDANAFKVLTEQVSAIQ
jgi:large subunit ribosomal protein L20